MPIVNSYVRPVCVPSQGAVWHWRHRETDPRAVCPCTSSDQSETEQRPGPSAESLPGDDPSVWQTEHQAGETLCQLVSQNTSGTRLDLCFAPYLSHLAWWEVIVMWLGANSSLIWKKLILLCYCHYETELTHSSQDFFVIPLLSTCFISSFLHVVSASYFFWHPSASCAHQGNTDTKGYLIDVNRLHNRPLLALFLSYSIVHCPVCFPISSPLLAASKFLLWTQANKRHHLFHDVPCLKWKRQPVMLILLFL